MGIILKKQKVQKPNEKLGRRPIRYKHNYKNYKPFDPVEIKEKYLYANRKDKTEILIDTEINRK